MSSFLPTQVRSHNGAPAIFVDEKPIHGMTATSVSFKEGEVVEGFVEGGVEILMIWIEAGLKCWNGPNQYDWSYAEEKLRHFEKHGGDTKWIIRVRLGLLDGWFAREFPDEVHSVHDEGRMAVSVIHSPIWLENVSQLVSDFVSWLETTRWAPRIIGFMLNAGATEEWLPFDTEAMFRGEYHPVIVREFRRWLEQEYQTEAALQEAWNDPTAHWHNQNAPKDFQLPTFENAGPPRGQLRRGSHIWGPFTLRDPARERPAIDYYRYLNHTLAGSLISLCQTAKSAASVPILCGGFHSYLWWESGVYSYIQEYGHALIQKLNESPDVDFVSDITSYDGRFPGGPSGYLGLAACQNLHNTLHYTEVDLTTCLNMSPQQRAAWDNSDKSVAPGSAEPILSDADWKWNLGHCGRDLDEQIAIMQREVGHNLITSSPYWWFDIKQRSFLNPELTEAMNKLSQIGADSMNWNRGSLAEVAFVCSEETPMFQSAMNGSLLRFELESAHPLLLDGCTQKWGLAGVPFDCYELHDLAHPDFPGDQYKLLIFVNCARVSDQAARGIERWKKDDKVHLWTFAAACLDDEHFQADLGADLIGMRLGCQMKRRNIHVEVWGSDAQLRRGGQSLNFGIEGSVGPVFYVEDVEDDDNIEVLGRLRDGGEIGFALRQHDGWRSIYLSMLNFGPQLLRNLARFAGAHVWCDSDDVIYANRSMLCFHAATSGDKTIRLPRAARVTDLISGEIWEQTEVTEFALPAYRTRLFRTEYL